MGYQWSPRIRIVPTDGVDATLTLSTAFAYASGPTMTNVSYRTEQEDRSDINRVRRYTRFGLRSRVRLRFEIGDTMADHATYVQIVNAYLHHDEVYLSMDGGTTEHQVELAGPPIGPTPFGGKVNAGAVFELELETKELLTELPAIGGGVW